MRNFRHATDMYGLRCCLQAEATVPQWPLMLLDSAATAYSVEYKVKRALSFWGAIVAIVGAASPVY